MVKIKHTFFIVYLLLVITLIVLTIILTFLTLSFIPEVIHLPESHISELFSSLFGLLLYVAKAADELGDFLFSVINAARLYHLNPDNALERTNQKFIRRFNYLEAKTKEQGRNLADMTLAEMDEIWNEAKARGL